MLTSRPSTRPSVNTVLVYMEGLHQPFESNSRDKVGVWVDTLGCRFGGNAYWLAVM